MARPAARICFALALTLLLSASALALDPTEVRSGKAKSRLLGVHRLEWARSDWTDFGTVRVRDVNGRLHLRGYLRHMNGRDHLRLDGTVREVRSRTFVFTGTLAALCSFANEGKPFRREGEMTFRAIGKHAAWRLVPEDPGKNEPLGEIRIRFDQALDETRKERERTPR